MKQKTILVGVAGASASGKSLLANTLIEELQSEHLCIISEDSYYKDQTHLTMEERVRTNYDHPDSMDHELMLEHMNQLKEGKAVDVPMYDYSVHNRKEECRHVLPARVVIIEGILLFTRPEIREAFDLRFYMDTPLDICLIRRLKRDIVERGRDVDSVIKQYLETVRPMFLQFIEPARQHAHLIIPHGGKNRIAIDLIKTKIRDLID
ncbi:uridine kinase [Endozoicomonas montiporae]|uniref:Uridine kinase n=2 Tax=Endozoicomonas montiporae TaxID=1027273 RepID=A0A081N5X4_9GAMM|nr:uridine kinase [Endozoicomonas montiporae]AMO57246.1 uridine kinase [Endozoicomonas montiporae CL-33]KEQ13847.1 uridine kinase [Endozoicomonas montiporae]